MNLKKTCNRARIKKVAALFSIITASVFSVLSFSQLQGQESVRIAAIVNDEMISVYDLKARITLVAAFSGFDNSSKTEQRLAPQVLQQLINERIRLQEAKRLNLKANEGEINNEKSALETQNKFKPGNLNKALTNVGINPETLIEQFKAKIVWSKIVHKKFSRNIQISEDEVNEVIDQIKRNKGKPEYLISENLLSTDTVKKAKESEKLATRVIQQISGGANFSAISRNFSQSTSA